MEERFKMFTVLISCINRSIRRIKTEEMAEFELKSPHVSCLYYIYKAGSLTATELRDICEEDKASISRSVSFLEENGYIVQASESQKNYRAPLTLTEKGRSVGEKIAQKIDRTLEAAGEGLSDDDRAVMYRSLALINANLQKFCASYGD